MRGGIPLFRFRGIDVRLHWTFLLLPAWIAYGRWSEGEDWTSILASVGLVLLVFLCVILHEFGHALTAQRYGIHTRDITLLPIGGVASLERMPEDPKQEFMITIAGPLVNLVIALLAIILIAATGFTVILSPTELRADSWMHVLTFLAMANMMLFLFNLIPAFPMDGGRILRSLLSMKMPRYKATRIATGLGRLLATCFAIYGLMDGHPFLALIGVFIFFAAGAEAKSVKHQNLLQGISVREVMRTNFWTLPLFAPIDRAVHELIAGGDKVAVVMDGQRYVGVITRDDMLAAVTAGRAHEPIRENSVRVIPGISPNDAAHDMYTQLIAAGYPIVPVIEHGKLIGIFEPENLAEYVQLKQAARGEKPD
jgi:Zn-dependent protease/predicted transcriptional regulator